MTKLRVLSLFAGIGGFDLGLERTGGFETVAFCEIDPFCQRVLAKHWPGVPCYDDVRTLTGEALRADGIVPDVIVGGFPCQDISVAGALGGIEAERSGLWSEFARLIGEIRPGYVVVENVANLLAGPSEQPGGWFGRVLGDLASLGLDAEWHCIPASAVGAPHRRDRAWIVAHSPFVQRNGGEHNRRGDSEGTVPISQSRDGSCNENVADAEQGRLAAWDEQHDGRDPILLAAGSCERGRDKFRQAWRSEPRLGRVAYGLPDQMDRLQSLGNAVVPQIPELIGNAILASLAEQRRTA